MEFLKVNTEDAFEYVLKEAPASGGRIVVAYIDSIVSVRSAFA